ncbi:unnamed protein product [Staurois parvus]|uniref:Uncharacterized protein n=1 Tax=Staurois parvus TaxID=386267 RepID=A0ABN9FXB2_9NEOB|nr:unnamed protein product [Staurois parvus]
MGPCNGLPLLLSPIATLCHVPLSGLLTHCWCVSIFFDIRVLARLRAPIASCQAP